MVVAWVEKVGLISPGIFGPIFGVIGFGGSAISSLVRLVEAFQELNEATIAERGAQDPRVKADLALGFGTKMAAIAFFVCAAAWGVLGGAHIILGGVQLALLVDTLFTYTVITFLAYFGSIIGTSLLIGDSKNLVIQKEGQSGSPEWVTIAVVMGLFASMIFISQVSAASGKRLVYSPLLREENHPKLEGEKISVEEK